VDALLIPEVDIVSHGPDGILPFIYRQMKDQTYAVVVIAEGAGEELLGVSSETDPGSNRKLPPIGEFMRNQIKDYFTAQGEESVVRYIDPSYTVRSMPANATAGYTGFSVGLVWIRRVACGSECWK
jgi:6-phosphofructokinase 1